MKAPKEVIKGRTSSKASRIPKWKAVQKIKWVSKDNCCLLYSIWETLTNEQQSLMTVSKSRVNLKFRDCL